MNPSLYILASVLALACGADFEYDISKIKSRDIRVPVPFSENIRGSPRVIGGQEAVPNSVPQQVALLILVDVTTYFCGGSLISPNWVLTAAHCIEDALIVQIIAGAHSPLQFEPTQQSQFSSMFVIHSGWNETLLTNDIALIYLIQPFNLNENVQFAKLPTWSQINNTLTGSLGIFSGWGAESDAQQTISDVLRWVEVNIIANLICNIAFLGVIQNHHLCTSGTANGNVVGACGGDSGSPLVLTSDNTTVGILSFGLGTSCEAAWPSVFTRVTSFLGWISANTGIEIEA